MDKTHNPRFFLRDYTEYIKKVLCLQLNVIRLKMDERIQVREEALCRAIIDNMLLQRIEGVNRGMFCLHSTRKCIRDDPVMVEAELLRLMMCL